MSDGSAEEAQATQSPERWWHRILVVALLAAAAAVVLLGPTEAWLEATVAWIEGLGAAGAAVFVLIYVAATVLFLPGSVLTIAAGFLFGLMWGTVLVSAASTAGAMAAFFIGRHLAQGVVSDKVVEYPRFYALYRAIEKEEFKVVLLTRLVPLFPFNFLNYAFGLTSVSWKRYLLASWIGMLPGTIAYVYAGTVAQNLVRAMAVEKPPGAAIYALWGLGAVAVVAGTWLLTRRARRELEAIIEESAEDQEESAPPT